MPDAPLAGLAPAAPTLTADPPTDGLNPDQLDAVVHRGGPLLVVAGAGSGKTRVLTHRIAHLDRTRASARRRSWRSRSPTRPPTRCATGSARWSGRSSARCGCARSTRRACASCARDAEALGYPRKFSIYDQADAVRLTGYVIRDLGLDAKRFTPRGVHGLISAVEERAARPRDVRRRGAEHLRPQARRRVRRVPGPPAQGRRDGLRRPAAQRRAAVPRAPRRARALPPALRAHPRRRVPGHEPGPERDRPDARRRPPQRLASSATPTSRCTASAGPTSATSCSSRTRSRTSPRSCSTRTTERRRRSSTPPTRSSRTTPKRKPKYLWTDTGGGDRIIRYHAEDEGDEAMWVARRRSQLHATTPTTGARWPCSTAPTPRAGSSKRRSCASACPYKVVGGTRFYDRREIKDAMAYLRAVVNPVDEVSIKRVLNVPKRGIGDTSVARLDALRRAPRGSASSRRCAAPTTPASPGPPSAASTSFVDLLDELDAMVARAPSAPTRCDSARATCCRRRSTSSGYLAELEAEDTVESAGRIENLGELVGSAREFTVLDEFLEQVALVADTDDLDDDDQVVLMTLHSAKGLEFPVVFIVGVEEGVFPHNRALTEPTRWRRNAASPTSASPGRCERLFVTHAWSRSLFGTTQYNPPSRFLDEIPAELIESKGNVTGAVVVRPPELPPATDWGAPPPVPPRRGGDDDGADEQRQRRAPRAGRRGGAARRPTRHARAERRPGPRAADRRRRRASGVRRGRHHRHRRGRARRPRRPSTSPASARSTSRWPGPLER